MDFQKLKMKEIEHEEHSIPIGYNCDGCKCCQDTSELKFVKGSLEDLLRDVESALKNKY